MTTGTAPAPGKHRAPESSAATTSSGPSPRRPRHTPGPGRAPRHPRAALRAPVPPVDPGGRGHPDAGRGGPRSRRGRPPEHRRLRGPVLAVRGGRRTRRRAVPHPGRERRAPGHGSRGSDRPGRWRRRPERPRRRRPVHRVPRRAARRQRCDVLLDAGPARLAAHGGLPAGARAAQPRRRRRRGDPHAARAGPLPAPLQRPARRAGRRAGTGLPGHRRPCRARSAPRGSSWRSRSSGSSLSSSSAPRSLRCCRSRWARSRSSAPWECCWPSRPSPPCPCSRSTSRPGWVWGWPSTTPCSSPRATARNGAPAGTTTTPWSGPWRPPAAPSPSAASRSGWRCSLCWCSRWSSSGPSPMPASASRRWPCSARCCCCRPSSPCSVTAWTPSRCCAGASAARAGACGAAWPRSRCGDR